MPSSAINDHSYDDDSQELLIEFVTGRRYIYEDVPVEVAAGLQDAESKGAYFNARIRDKYVFRELK
jgi:hypothetical protein